MREEELERQMDEELSKITILPEFREWALESLGKDHKREVEKRTKIYETQQKALNDAQARLDRLTDMRLRDLLTDDEYTSKRDEIQKEIKVFKRELTQTEGRAEKWLELTEQVFNFATYARIHFHEGDMHAKKQIMMSLGSNPTIKDKKLSIDLSEFFIPIAEAYPELERAYLALEPTKNSQCKRKNAIEIDSVLSGSRYWTHSEP